MKTQLKHFLYFILLLAVNTIYAQNKNEIEDQIYLHLEKALDLKERLDYKEALVYCNEALTLSLKIKDKEYEAKTHRVMGDILMLDNNLPEALIKLKKASQIQKSNDYKEELAITRNTQGLVHTELGSYSQALNYFNSASKLYQELQLFSNNTNILKNKGKLYLKKGDYKKADETFDEAYKSSQRFAREYTKSEILLFKSQALIKLKKTDEAINSCNKAIDIGNANKYPWIITEGYKTLSEIYEESGNPIRAIFLLKKHNTLRDSIYSIEDQRLSAEEIAKFNFAAQGRRIERQGLIIQQNEEQIKQNQIMTFLGAAFLILFFTFILFLYYSNQKRKNANSLLQNANYQLVIAKDEAVKATKTKANFLSTITHELRTPLYTVTGLTDLLLDENPTESQKGYLKSLRFSGDYLLNFINDILDVNKIEANKIELEKISFNLKKLAKNVLYTLNKPAQDNNTTLHLNFEDSIPKHVIGDSLRLSQILINLVSNAIKFTKNGKVFLNIKNISSTENNTKLLIEVEDTGIGISYDKQEEIFESFSQGSVQINRKYGGTGLGLTIVKNLLELMNSKIQLKSEPEKGTSFFFEIAFEIAEEEILIEQKKNDFLPENLFDILKDKNILLVDDVKINQLITKKTLSKKEINCVTADNGNDAVLRAKEQKFDLILMDVHMPGISGIEATKIIREFDKETPIIALTAITIEKDDLITFNEAGFNDILSKPFKSDTFFKKIYQQLTK